jgi:hypothetical protein
MSDEQVTQGQYIERWEQALRVLESMDEHEREKHFDMSMWGARTSCGTVACVAGHCSFDPWFREHGFSGKFDEDHDVLRFPQAQPLEFFGKGGAQAVLFAYQASYDEVVGYVREHIEKLKEGVSPDDVYVDREPKYECAEWDEDYVY